MKKLFSISDVFGLIKSIRQSAQSAADIAVLAAHAAAVSASYRATFAEAITDFVVGSYFTCSETGTVRMYKRTSTPPYYIDQGDGAAPIVKVQLETYPRFLKLSSRSIAGSTDDEAAFQAAQTAAAAAGQLGVSLDKVLTTFKPARLADATAHWSVAGQRPDNLSPGERLDARGTRVYGAPTGGWGERSTLYANCIKISEHLITTALSVGAKVIPLANVTGLAVRDWVILRMGDIPDDTPETINWHITRLISVGTSDVTLADPIPRSFAAGDLAVATLNKYLTKITPITDEINTDITFEPGCAVGLDIQGMIGGSINSITGPCPAGCALTLQYSKSSTTALFNVWDNSVTGSNQGGAFRCAETEHSFGRFVTSNVVVAGSFEAASTVNIGWATDSNSSSISRTVWTLNSASELSVGRQELRGLGGQSLFNQIDAASHYHCQVLDVRTATAPAQMGELGKHIKETLRLNIGAAAEEIYDVSLVQWTDWIVIPLTNSGGGSKDIIPPNTIVVDAEIYASAAGVSGLTLARLSRKGNTTHQSVLADIVATKFVRPSTLVSWDAGSGFNSTARNEGVTFNWTSNGSGALNGEFLLVRVSYVRNRAVTSSASPTYAQDYAIDLAGTAYTTYPYDPPSLASGAVNYTYISFPGAKKSDHFMASFSQPSIQVSITAQALDDNGTVGVAFKNLNPSGSGDPAVDLGAGFINLRLVKK